MDKREWVAREIDPEAFGIDRRQGMKAGPLKAPGHTPEGRQRRADAYAKADAILAFLAEKTATI